jgi:predicted nucleic acid-binding protein
VKTYVLDASALFSFLQRKASAVKVGDLFKDALRGHCEIFMSSVNFGEVYGLILKTRGLQDAVIATGTIYSLPIQLVDATPQRAMKAADVKHRHRLYYADSFAAALSLEYKATLVTSDNDFRRAANAVSILWLKN